MEKATTFKPMTHHRPDLDELLALWIMQRFGFQAVSMDAARVLHESEIQLLFQRAKPLRADVSPVDLYGPNARLSGGPPGPSA